jgi:transcriptional regulator GlxA family with amidase domain
MDDKAAPRDITVVLFDGFQLLDVFGPLDLFGALKDQFRLHLVGPEPDLVASTQGAKAVADCSYEDAPNPDVLLVPEGIGTRRLVGNPTFLGWLGNGALASRLRHLGVHRFGGARRRRTARRISGDLEQARVCVGARARPVGHMGA